MFDQKKRRGRPPITADGRPMISTRITLEQNLLDDIDIHAELWFDGNRSALIRAAIRTAINVWTDRPPIK